ncbi:HAMP domain-containing protein [Caldimonas thermodepolymerans]|jgi:Osmosensitive K+ channel histidine kinase|uniref:Signal transduction histidine-protein kinase/phosphatase MprB n=1 Tax=Caldimonas thermodepolymerans TaxID=215580 RepID=A0A2S5T6W7_9BURK|nr:ATP-binding protein [Caldimonas thermodepolymerans]PPE70706.1 two-component sensor histidine kinase [Caldimonas thermodepolymerans]QPC33207.1 HAMP domain-containing protein [Caldimonas thermodepolymerans]RDH97525.1 two-component system sensor histidine kinase GlrK [Caldimonas thermodepolymerans]TCP09937.1 two-component system sensor histidine kinase GlrK [Caldimonas thermodepolymerans]UZG46322.1 ATP-binding protein [Caldimonas thermodepolymerans]
MLKLLHRVSFRQLLLVAFLLIAAVLGAVSVRGLLTLERLIAQARAGAEQSMELTAQAQALADRNIGLERTARQYVVLDDPALHKRFEEELAAAETVLDRLTEQGLPARLADDWRLHMDSIREQMQGPRATALMREQTLSLAFRELADVTTAVAEQVRRANEKRNRELQQELEAGRLVLARQVLAAIAVSVLLAFAFGLWLARPLKDLERAIVGLGENRMDEPIEIRGPTDVREVGRRLDWLRLRLAELDADKARFLRHISHELKTPLAALREGVALLEDEVAGKLTDNQREIAHILRHNTGVLQRQIEDLLRFNAAAFEARRLQRRRTDLRALLRQLVDEQKLQWQAKHLRVEITGEPLHAEVDPDKLGTAVGNLLSNAIRFSPPGGTIRFSVTRSAGLACIDIVDEGPGVSPADRARVFEPFYRGERQPEGAARGTGVGLSIVQEYVAAHGGRVELLPNAPGAHFRIELPHAA